MKIAVEKITEDNHLTLEEQQLLLDDLMMVEAIVFAYENYCRSIGKFKEAVTFIKKFLEKLQNENIKEAFNRKGGDA